MNNFKELVKVFFFSGFNVNKKKKNQKSAFNLLLIFGAIFFVISFSYNFGYMNLAIESGFSLDSYMVIIMTIDAFLVLMTTIISMQGTIFKTKDYEFLESLPVSKQTIVSAKITSVYLIGLFEDLIITIPAIIFYIIYTGNIYGGLISLIATFFVSIIPILMSSLIASIVSIISAKSKHQELITTIFNLIVILLPLSIGFLVDGGDDLTAKLAFIFPYLKLFEISFDITKFYYFIIFLLIHVVSAIIVVVLISLIYRPMNNYLGNIRFHEEYKTSNTKEELTIDKAIYKKELNMISKNAKYSTNSFLGGVIYLILGLVLLIIPSSFGEMPDTEELTISTVDIMAAIVIGMGVLYNSMMTSTSASISLESKNFSLLASYPISSKLIIKNKLKVGIIIPLIINAVSGITLAIIYTIMESFDLFTVLELILLPILASINIAVIGMLCGLRWPKFDYQNEMQVLKNSAAVNFTMLFSALPGMFMMTLIMILNIAFENAWVSLIVAIVFYAISIGISSLILSKKGERLFERAKSI